MTMALSVEKLLTDAHTLIIRLKDHDTLADSIIATTQTLFNKIEAMKQYQDDIAELNEIAKHRPRSTLVLGIAQENRQIRELQQENRELQAALEEHQSALELIMQKYREHTVKLIQSNKIERALQEKDIIDKESVCHLMDKIDEMAGVMQKAIEVDETSGCADKERLSRLEIENRALRELLEICTTSREKILQAEAKVDMKKERDDEADDDDTNTDTEGDSSVVLALDKKDDGDKKEAAEKKSKPSSSRETTPTNTSPKTPGASKSATELKKGKTSISVTPAVKKTVSATGVKKDIAPLKKSPSVETKKDTKSKLTPKPVTKK
ncbi:FGFR1 oncogene partner 2 homolog [Biomphalaria glabrata]|uniref:FGFR1 oncogene partner 2 homolog n=1 Tax=Biomphalaria glabrata TaxID=6526 RepID=A0A9W3BJE2_BIOGL|nr:FGFR1 oncogene partner 2 homolog [Biomphalaria glabrata]XP_055899657.1 FGFR1 oncogene partner 2 homolog [Biomphalaria glabrata]KAI8760098.1 DNA ligase 1 [Biomphalaria glabrata]